MKHESRDPRPEFNLSQAPHRMAQAFSNASPAKRAGMIAVGAAVVAASPYWVPAVMRSKTARRVAAFGASFMAPRLLG